MTTSSTPESPANGPTEPVPAVTVELTLTGMHCLSCVQLIQETLAAQSGVLRAAVDLDSAVARVGFDRSTVTVDELCAAVISTGYGASVR
jgi:Cu+-exporting ATPase